MSGRAAAVRLGRIWGAVGVCFGVITTVVSAEEPGLFKEPHRPQFHFTPERNWMNDPNGLVYFEGEYHLFHQYNPHGDTWGHMSWGHAVSADILHWKHLPVALAEEGGVMMFSGSAVVDRGNTSGFGVGGKPAVVAVYTGHGHGKQTQNVAYSNDRGRTWTKFAGNPVIDEGLKDFRDPKVFWHEATKRWVMAVSVSDRKVVRFYGSADLKKWERLGEFGPEGASEGVWECPDLFELPVVDARDGATGKKMWVLAVSVSGGAPAGGNGCQYFVGEFDGKGFRNLNEKGVVLWADYGPDFYAPQTWSDMPDGRRVWVGWMTNFRYSGVEPTKPWRGAQSFPRELSLVETAGGVRLAQRPVREIEGIRGEALFGDGAADAGQQIELDLEFPANADAAVRVHEDAERRTVVGYDARERRLYVDRTRSRSGEPFQKDFPGRYSAPVAADGDGRVRVKVLVDTSSVEVFGNGGLSVITANTFAPATARGWSVENTRGVGGKPEAVSVHGWRLKSVWDKQ